MIDSETPRTEDYSALWLAIDELVSALAYNLKEHERGKPLTAQEVIEQADTLIRKARSLAMPQVTDMSVHDLLAGYWQYAARRQQCAPTGFASLNKALGGGLESSRLVVLLGAPGAGKTALANQIADHVADSARPVLYVTSEDSPFALLAKTLARIGNVNYTAVLKAWASEQSKIAAALALQAERASSDHLRYVDATQGLSLDQIRRLASAHFRGAAGQGVLVVDYLQRFARAQRDLLATGRDLREVVTLLTEQLRALACELDCCVIALASQSRAGYNGGGGNALASAKESGDIEYTADVIMALTEDSARKPGASWLKPRSLALLKNRQGDTSTIALDWQGDKQQFTEAQG